MSLSKRHHNIQVVLKTIDHLRYHQVTGLVVLHRKKKECVSNEMLQCNEEIQQENMTKFKPLQPSLIYFQTGSVTTPLLPLYIVDSKEVSQGILFLLKRNRL